MAFLPARTVHAWRVGDERAETCLRLDGRRREPPARDQQRPAAARPAVPVGLDARVVLVAQGQRRELTRGDGRRAAHSRRRHASVHARRRHVHLPRTLRPHLSHDDAIRAAARGNLLHELRSRHRAERRGGAELHCLRCGIPQPVPDFPLFVVTGAEPWTMPTRHRRRQTESAPSPTGRGARLARHGPAPAPGPPLGPKASAVAARPRDTAACRADYPELSPANAAV
jgi:hypothetical protein